MTVKAEKKWVVVLKKHRGSKQPQQTTTQMLNKRTRYRTKHTWKTLHIRLIVHSSWGGAIACPLHPSYLTVTRNNLEFGSNEHFVRFVALINSIREMQGQMATKQGNVPTFSLSDAPKTFRRELVQMWWPEDQWVHTAARKLIMLD